MQDVSGGANRSRKWPAPRNRAKTKAEQEKRDRFASAQRAAKYISPQQALDHYNATDGTPLLPRDLITSMLYGRLTSITLPTGKELYPLVARTEISAGLDVLGQTPGSTLIRKAEMWEAEVPSQSGLSGVTVERPSLFTNTGSNAWQSIPWTSSPIDQAVFWNPLQPTKITIPFDGWYLGSFSTNCQTGVNNYRQIRIMGPNGPIARASTGSGNQGVGEWLTASTPFYATTGQELTCDTVNSATNRQYKDSHAAFLLL